MPIITVYRKTSPWRYTSSCPEVLFIEHIVETMSIGFRRQEREKAKKFKKYEPGVKTPFRAVEKWFVLKPKIVKQNPCIFKNKILYLQPNKSPSFHKQPCET